MNDVFIVTSAADGCDPLVVKFGTYSSSRDLRAGVGAYRILSRYTSLPVPTVYATDFTGDVFPPVVVMGALPGEPLAADFRDTERLTNPDAVRLLGTVVDAFGRVPDSATAGYGFVRRVGRRDDDYTLVGEYEDFPSWLVDYASAFYEDPPEHDALQSVVPSVLNYLHAHRDRIPSRPRASVVITDLSPQNVLCPGGTPPTNGDSPTGVIDLERAKLGPVEFTAVNVEYLLTRFVEEPSPVREALYDPLSFGPDVPLRELYRVVAMGRSVGALAFWYDPGSETFRRRGDEIAAELERIVG